MMFPIKIKGCGHYLPSKIVLADEIARQIDIDPSMLKNQIGFTKRHRAVEQHETVTWMAAEAAKSAIVDAGLEPKDLDLILSASGIPQQPLPCNAAMIQQYLGLSQYEIPSFDINSTCLSFLSAFNIASHFIQSGTHKRILIASSDIASIGINWSHRESAALFGDGAAAVVVERTSESDHSCLHSFRMKTVGDYSDVCRIDGGLSKLHASKMNSQNHDHYLFHMDGSKLFRISLKHLPSLVDQVLADAGLAMREIDHVIPHQASLSALKLVQKKIGANDGQFALSICEYGNVIAASLPLTFKMRLDEKGINRGEKVLFIGTSAGVSLAAMVITY